MAKFEDPAGKPHTGTYFAYVRVSTDKQWHERQIAEIKTYLNGGDHKIHWYEEEESGSVHPKDRPVLQQCLSECRENNGTFIIAHTDRFSRKDWHTLQFFDIEVDKGGLQIIVCDDPTMCFYKGNTMLKVKAMVSDIERQNIAEKTQSALAVIKHRLEQDGQYITKAGKTITKLGQTSNMSLARENAIKTISSRADLHAETVYEYIRDYRDMGYSYQVIAEKMNHLGVKTFKAESAKSKWHGSSVRNAEKRMEKKINTKD